jgi:chorismate mutase
MINELRKKIDKIDKKISKQLSKRYQIIKKIAEVKQNNKLHVYNKVREDEHLNDIIKNTKEEKECQNYLFKIFREIFKISREIQ